LGIMLFESGSAREDIEQLINETNFVFDVRLAHQEMTSTDHEHDFETLDGSSRRLHRPQSSCVPNNSFESTVVGLDDVVDPDRARGEYDPYVELTNIVVRLIGKLKNRHCCKNSTLASLLH